MATLKEQLYNVGVDTFAFLGKLGIILLLPIKFIKFWGEAWKKNTKK